MPILPLPNRLAFVTAGCGGTTHSLDVQKIYTTLDLSAWVGRDNDATSYEYLRNLDRKNTKKIDYIKFPSNFQAQRTRSILIDWLISVTFGNRLEPESLFLASYILDRNLITSPLVDNFVKNMREITEITAAAMHIATKYVEIYPLESVDLAYHMKIPAVTPQSIVLKEIPILRELDFCVSTTSPLLFLERCMIIARAVEYNNIYVLTDLKELAMYILITALLDITGRAYTSNLLAISAFAISHNLVYDNGSENIEWPDTYEYYTKYNLKDMVQCIKQLLFFIIRYQDDNDLSAAALHYSKKRGELLGVAVRYRSGVTRMYSKINKYITDYLDLKYQ